MIECIGEEASHRFEGEDGVKSSVDDVVQMARDGYLWVTTPTSWSLSLCPPISRLLRRREIGGPLFPLEPAYSEKNAMDHIVEFRGVVSVNDKLAIFHERGPPIYTVRKSKIEPTEVKQIEGIAGGATYSGTYNKHTGLLYIGGNVGIFAYDVASDEIVHGELQRRRPHG